MKKKRRSTTSLGAKTTPRQAKAEQAAEDGGGSTTTTTAPGGRQRGRPAAATKGKAIKKKAKATDSQLAGKAATSSSNPSATRGAESKTRRSRAAAVRPTQKIPKLSSSSQTPPRPTASQTQDKPHTRQSVGTSSPSVKTAAAASSSPRTPSRSPKSPGARSSSVKWSPVEVAVLRHSQRQTTPTDQYFWDQVASQVSKDCGTSRSAQSCVEKYHELCIASATTGPGRKPSAVIHQEKKRRKPKALSFSLDELNFGTNKRKRVLRSMVKKVEENYHDDYFAESGGDLMPTLSFSDDDFEVDGPLLELASSAPSSAPSSPEILRPVDRDEIDGYITQITKKVGKVRRGRQRSEIELSEEGKEQSPTKKQRGSEEDDATAKNEEEVLPSPWAQDDASQDLEDEEVSLTDEDEL